MSAFHDGRDAIEGYWTWAAVLGFLGALLRWLRPKRLVPSLRGALGYLTAIREYETAMATALYWKQEAERERIHGLRWKALYEVCLSEQQAQHIPARPSARSHELDAGYG